MSFYDFNKFVIDNLTISEDNLIITNDYILTYWYDCIAYEFTYNNFYEITTCGFYHSMCRCRHNKACVKLFMNYLK